MRNCIHCGTANPSDARFCSTCGHLIENDLVQQGPGERRIDVMPPVVAGSGQLPGNSVSTVSGIPQPGHMPAIQGVPSLSQPGNPSIAPGSVATSSGEAAKAQTSPTSGRQVRSHASAVHSNAQGGMYAAKIMTPKVIVSIIAAIVVIAGGITTFTLLQHKRQGIQVSQPIQKIIDDYYRLVEQSSYSGIYDNYVAAGTRVNGQNYQGPTLQTPPIRVMVEGFWITADQTKGKVSSYTITRVSQDNAGFTRVVVNETRNGSSYDVELVFLDLGSRWMLWDIRGI